MLPRQLVVLAHSPRATRPICGHVNKTLSFWRLFLLNERETRTDERSLSFVNNNRLSYRNVLPKDLFASETTGQ